MHFSRKLFYLIFQRYLFGTVWAEQGLINKVYGDVNVLHNKRSAGGGGFGEGQEAGFVIRAGLESELCQGQ